MSETLTEAVSHPLLHCAVATNWKRGQTMIDLLQQRLL